MVPPTVEIKTVPTQQSMASDLEATFTGGAPDAIVRMTLVQSSYEGLVAVDCDVPASAGRVVLPSVMFHLLQSGEAQLNLTNAALRRVPLDAWEVEASAPGLVQQNGALFSRRERDARPLTRRRRTGDPRCKFVHATVDGAASVSVYALAITRTSDATDPGTCLA